MLFRVLVLGILTGSTVFILSSPVVPRVLVVFSDCCLRDRSSTGEAVSSEDLHTDASWNALGDAQNVFRSTKSWYRSTLKVALLAWTFAD